jgi:hypothetical protein
MSAPWHSGKCAIHGVASDGATTTVDFGTGIRALNVAHPVSRNPGELPFIEEEHPLDTENMVFRSHTLNHDLGRAVGVPVVSNLRPKKRKGAPEPDTSEEKCFASR